MPTQVPADFVNLATVYADAVLHPHLRFTDFLQEGHRCARLFAGAGPLRRADLAPIAPVHTASNWTRTETLSWRASSSTR